MNVQSSYLTGRTVWKLLQNNNKNYRSNTISMVDLFFRYIIKALSTAMTMSVFGFARIKLILSKIDVKLIPKNLKIEKISNTCKSMKSTSMSFTKVTHD